VLEDGSSADIQLHEQAARLARHGVSAISVIWIRRAWVESSGTEKDQGCARWFAGDPPYALRVLLAALDRLSLLETQVRSLRRQEGQRRSELHRQHKKDGRTGKPNIGVPLTRGIWLPDLMPAAQLLREIYPDDWPEPVGSRWPQLAIDWNGQRRGLDHHFQALLKAREQRPHRAAAAFAPVPAGGMAGGLTPTGTLDPRRQPADRDASTAAERAAARADGGGRA
jgi:hypothetical protein